MAAKENLFPLKLLVFSLAALLIGGMVLLVAMVFQKTGSECAPQPLQLEAGEHVMNVSPSNGNVQVTTISRQGGMQVLNVDGCTGKQLSRLEIRTKPAQ